MNRRNILLAFINLTFCRTIFSFYITGGILKHYKPNLSISMNTDIELLELPAKLKSYVKSFSAVPDERLRYQQLLYLANKLEPMPNELKTPENKVPGCLSTVHIHATSRDGNIYYVGDSDGQLTKGLVALLVNGLSGCSVEEINKVKPSFIQYAGIASSLTPGRNNGFLNMMAVMKKKAAQLHAELIASNTAVTENNENISTVISPSSSSISSAGSVVNTSGMGPIQTSIVNKLSMLKPIKLLVENESSRHAGHSGMLGSSNSEESHFKVTIVASCFANLSLVQRHKMIYTLLAQELSPTGGAVHALSISAKTPDE